MRDNNNHASQRIGVLTKREYAVLELRLGGLSQKETAKELGTTRANVSMIEQRARRRLKKARETVRAYELLRRRGFKVVLRQGTEVAKVPKILERAHLRRHMDLDGTLGDVVKFLNSSRPECLSDKATLNHQIVLRVDTGGNFHLERSYSIPS